ncbi:hypothetical protein J5069_08720 [Candidatus Symbiopectobacterium sp. NZEC127]|uniref:hypothetical protein n=1 Tax=Candidatus Symbiopectobacterium sp. NZEC127 TaxID=2820472 RepID=UPI002226032F|nr:hypothetical protein [Candidatus Symbiopectobacterium sp. NZEC127]MCW2485976.1 hypothetical protein [Candidatus Symbiopectobacterium sp. NZEC127]
MLTRKIKTIVKWSAITFISCCYFIALFFAKRNFSDFTETESRRVSSSMTIGEYHNAVSIAQVNSGVIDEVGFFGFFICIALILFIFKKNDTIQTKRNGSMFFLRWGGIIFILSCYLIGVFISLQPMSVFMENETLQLSNPVSAQVYSYSLQQIKEASDRIFYGYVYGFLVCMPLITILFKKVRTT